MPLLRQLSLSVDDPDDRPFCATSPLRPLMVSERFAKHEDDQADAHFCGFDILRKEKRLIDKVQGQGRLKQAYVEYAARKRKTRHPVLAQIRLRPLSQTGTCPSVQSALQ